MFFMYVVICIDIIIVTYHAKKMPGEPGELEAMSYAFRGCTGLQHEVIAMASCCKKGGDGSLEGLSPTSTWNFWHHGP
ncbi:hypothetical protein [Escherichia coli]|uniref:hypothetical protein n=1 Tax=Escherichia coli TaxID=562 RepID=UPI0020BFDC0F|nr:hypothetical protein [Escherichia coli]